MGYYEDKARRIGQLVDEKNEAYGDAFKKSGEVLRIFYPDGIKPDQYDDMLAIVRVIDKLFRIASGHNGAFKEDAWTDIAGYGILKAADRDYPWFIEKNKRRDG